MEEEKFLFFGPKNTLCGIINGAYIIQCNLWFPRVSDRTSFYPPPPFHSFAQKDVLQKPVLPAATVRPLCSCSPTLASIMPSAARAAVPGDGDQRSPRVSPASLGSLPGKLFRSLFRACARTPAGCTYLHLPQGSAAFFTCPQAPGVFTSSLILVSGLWAQV